MSFKNYKFGFDQMTVCSCLLHKTNKTKEKIQIPDLFFRIWIDICKIMIVSSEWLFSKEYPVWSGWPFWSCVYLRIGDAFDCVQRYTVGQPLTGSCLSDIIYVKNWVYLEISDIFIYGEKLSPPMKLSNKRWKLGHISSFFCAWKTEKKEDKKKFFNSVLKDFPPTFWIF